MHIRCIYLWSTPLDPDACMYDSRFYEAHVLDEDECMYTCMMHKSIMRTNQQADSGSMCVWCLYLWSMILDLDTCVYDVHTCVYDVHVCVRCAHIWCAYGVYGTYIYDPGLWSWYKHVWCTYLRSLILIHVCIMQVCMMNFDPQSLALMHVWCMNVKCTYLWSWCMHVSMMRQILFRTDERTNEQGDSRSWIQEILVALTDKYFFLISTNIGSTRLAHLLT